MAHRHVSPDELSHSRVQCAAQVERRLLMERSGRDVDPIASSAALPLFGDSERRSS
jgi:hypothetical protein